MNLRRQLSNLSKSWNLGLFLLVQVLICVSAAPTFNYHPAKPLHPGASPRQPYVEVRNYTSGPGPREEATAACAVRTAGVSAAANATVTRRLHGVVTSRELHSSIQRLEVIIFGQMQQLWRSLDALREAGVAPPDRRTVLVRYRPD